MLTLGIRSVCSPRKSAQQLGALGRGSRCRRVAGQSRRVRVTSVVGTDHRPQCLRVAGQVPVPAIGHAYRCDGRFFSQGSMGPNECTTALGGSTANFTRPIGQLHFVLGGYTKLPNSNSPEPSPSSNINLHSNADWRKCDLLWGLKCGTETRANVL